MSALPSVDRIISLSSVQPLIETHGRTFVTVEARALLTEWRAVRLRGDVAQSLDESAIAATLTARIATSLRPKLGPVFNLTGTVLHTNMGRALLAEEAVAAIARTASVSSNVEFDLATGERGDRDAVVEEQICALTGGEAATIVNNNAAAVLLTVAALAAKREVIVSRGELVEIGGSFRMPDVVKSAGARMVEVGTTNRTHARDYVGAVTPKTALILKVHTSNFVVKGFTAAVDDADLADIAHRANIPFAVDLGSGSLVDLAKFGLPREPLPQDALARGADVVTFSGDKLLGGPQAGLIVGKAAWISKIKQHPLKRALRVSKLTLAALEATLALYRHPEQLTRRLPTLRLLTRSVESIEASAQRLAPLLSPLLGPRFSVACAGVQSQIGSGALPLDLLPSVALIIRCKRRNSGDRDSGRPLQELARALRALPVPVIGRISDNALILDLRALEDEATFAAQLPQLDMRGSPP